MKVNEVELQDMSDGNEQQSDRAETGRVCVLSSSLNWSYFHD